MSSGVRYVASRTALIYAVLAGLWILISGRVVTWMSSDAQVVARLEAYKGWFFVLVTTGLLYAGLRRQLFRIEQESLERQRTNDALSASERRYRLLAENVGDVVWVLEAPSMRTVYVSPSVERLRGCTVAEALAEDLEQAFAPESAKVLRDELPARIREWETGNASGVIRSQALELYRKDRTRIWVEVVTTLVRRNDGGIEIVGVCRDISERRRAEAELRESEERFRAVAETAPMAIFIEAGGTFAYLNPMARTMFSAATLEELHGQPVADRFHPENRDQVIKLMHERGMGRTDGSELELAVLRADGGTTDISLSAVPFTYRGTAGALVFGRDITESKHALERLRLHELTLRETGEIARVGGWSLNPVTGEGFWTDEVARIHDLDPASQTSLSSGLGFYRAESRTRIEAAVREAIEHGTPYDLLLEMTTAKNRTKWVRTIGHPVVENGKVTVVRGSFQDVTELHEASAALRESEARFRQIAENINEVFWILDITQSRLLYVSPAFETIWKRDAGALVAGAFAWAETLHPDDAVRVVDSLRTKLVTGHYDETYRILLPDGEVRWIHDRGYPVRDANGRIYRAIGTAEDVTERRKLEDQFRHAQKMQAIGTLAGGIAHDFNNLLGAINGFAELAELQVEKQSEVAEYLQDIRTAGKRAAGLVRQILAFSRRSSSERAVMQLLPIVEEAQRLLRATLPSTIEMDVRFAARLWAVRADPTHVHQVIMNLGTNAWHAMRDRTGRIEIALENFVVSEELAESDRRLRAGRYVRISISDTGCGMDAGTTERAFEPFFTTKPPGEGTGLGLSVVHGIMQEHEGAVTVYSAPGEGTVFHLYFPAADAAVDETGAEAGRLRRGTGQRILFVDDEAPLVRVGRSMLQEIGYKPEGASGVQEALATLRHDPAGFDLIVTDQTMPGMTGVEFFGELRRIGISAPVILVTGYSATLTSESVRTLGMADLLLKPLSLERLANAIHDVLHNTRKSP